MPFLPAPMALGARLQRHPGDASAVGNAGGGGRPGRPGRNREAGSAMSKVPGRRYSAQSGASMGMSLAFEFAGAVVMFWFIGRLVDGWLDVEPWGQVTGGVVGWIGGIAHVFYAVQNRGGRTQGGLGRTPEKERRNP